MSGDCYDDVVAALRQAVMDGGRVASEVDARCGFEVYSTVLVKTPVGSVRIGEWFRHGPEPLKVIVHYEAHEGWRIMKLDLEDPDLVIKVVGAFKWTSRTLLRR